MHVVRTFIYGLDRFRILFLRGKIFQNEVGIKKVKFATKSKKGNQAQTYLIF